MIITLRTRCGCDRSIRVPDDCGPSFVVALPPDPIAFTSFEPMPYQEVRVREFIRQEFRTAYPIYLERASPSVTLPTVKISSDILTELEELRAENKSLRMMNESLRKCQDGLIGAFRDLAKGKTRGDGK